MSSDSTEIVPDKPVKRVRFSDDIASVYEYDPEEDSGNFPLEGENITVSSELHNVEQNKFVTEESVTMQIDVPSETDAANPNKGTSEYCDDKVHELIDCGQQRAATDDSYKAESSSSYVHRDSLMTDCFNNNKSNLGDLNLIIHETKKLTISGEQQVQELEMCSSTTSNAGGNVPQATVQSVEQNANVVTRKRSSEGVLIERQTTKINTCLQSDNSNISSAIDIKNAVFNAWNNVKNLSAKADSSSVTLEVSEKKASPQKPCDIKSESEREISLKRKKHKIRNTSSNQPEKTSQKEKDKKDDEESKMASPQKPCDIKSESEREISLKRKRHKIRNTSSNQPEKTSQKEKYKKDDEESKMAFRAWKKKKDELLTQQIAEKHKKEEKKRLDTLMNERMRKSDAESAYLAWISHKSAIINMEKKKTQWLLEKEKMKLTEKIKRNDEAAKIYYKWLRSKVFSKKFMNNYHQTEDKPPWTPPGKANSLI